VNKINLITISSDWKFCHRKAFIREVNKIIGEVVVIESPFSLLISILFSFRKRFLPLLVKKIIKEQVEADLNIITPIILFHEKFWNKFFFALKIDSFLFSLQINRYIKKRIKDKKIYLWIYQPIQYYFQKDIYKDFLIYDFYDNFELDSNGKKIESNSNLNTEISKVADLILCVSEKTYNLFDNNKEKVLRIFNGYSPEIFLNNSGKEPELIKKINLPIIGFNGPIRDWLDFELLEELLKTEKYCLIIIGYIDRSGKEGFKKLKRYENFTHIDYLPMEEMANYVNFFDAGILPYKVNDFNNSIFPNKVFEFFACNLPVVSTKISEMAKFKDYIYYSADRQEFIKNCELAIKSDKTVLAREYEEILRKASWTNVVSMIKESIDKNIESSKSTKNKIV